MSASAYLLRTMASVAPGTRVVDLAAGDGMHADALARLGFDVWASVLDPTGVDRARARLADALGDPAEAERRVSRAAPDALGYPDAFAPWAVAALDAAARDDAGALAGVFAEARRVLVPGGWLWTDVPGADAADLDDRLAQDTAAVAALLAAATAAGLAVASRPFVDEARGTVVAVFRRVDAGTVG